MQTCSKLNKARAPASTNLQELAELRQQQIKFCKFPGSPYGAIWLAITDAEDEGQWRDYYTGQEVSQELLEVAVGGLDGGRSQNCGIVS